MHAIIECSGGCKNGVKIKYKKKANIELNNLNFNFTNTNHSKPDLFECKSCGLIFSEFIKVDFSSKYQDVNDEKYISQIKYKKIYFENLFKKIENDLNKHGNTLEIGSYYGVCSYIAKQSIKNFYSLELSRRARDYSFNNFNVSSIAINPLDYLENKKNFFDAILMFDVIEHLDNPFEFIEKLSLSLKKNGKFIFTTFDMNSFLPKIMKQHYHWIMPMHKYYFSKKTLEFYFNKNSLKIYKVLNDDRTISVEYLFYKLKILFPKFRSIFNNLSKNQTLLKKNIKINLFDLKIFFVEKI